MKLLVFGAPFFFFFRFPLGVAYQSDELFQAQVLNISFEGRFSKTDCFRHTTYFPCVDRLNHTRNVPGAPRISTAGSFFTHELFQAYKNISLEDRFSAMWIAFQKRLVPSMPHIPFADRFFLVSTRIVDELFQASSAYFHFRIVFLRDEMLQAHKNISLASLFKDDELFQAHKNIPFSLVNYSPFFKQELFQAHQKYSIH